MKSQTIILPELILPAATLQSVFILSKKGLTPFIMHRTIIMIANLLFFLSPCFSQNANIQWQQAFGGSDYDEPAAIIQSRDGGLVATGFTFSSGGDVTKNHGGADAWILKMNREGQLQWQVSVGGSADDFAYGITETMDSGFVIAGETKSCEGNFSSNHGFSDGLLAKVDSRGKLLWTKLYGSPGNDKFNAVFENADGSIVAAGTVACHENEKGATDFWLLKVNADRTVIWSRHLGGAANDRLVSAMKSNSGYMLCGNTISRKGNAATGYYRKTNGLIINTDTDGNELWKKTIGGSNDDVITSSSLTIDQGCLIGAITDSNDGMLYNFKQSSNTDCWLLKISAVGAMEWQTVVFDEGQGLVANTVLETMDGGYFIGGTASQRSVMMKFSVDRVLDWVRLGDRKKETGKAFVQMTDSSFIMAAAGFTYDNYIRNKGFEDFCVVKMKPVNDISNK